MNQNAKTINHIFQTVVMLIIAGVLAALFTSSQDQLKAQNEATSKITTLGELFRSHLNDFYETKHATKKDVDEIRSDVTDIKVKIAKMSKKE